MAITFAPKTKSETVNALAAKKGGKQPNALKVAEQSSKPYIKRKGDGVEIGIKLKW